MTYPYESAPTKEVGISLWLIERHEWAWREVDKSEHAFIRRHKLACKATTLIAHDRILNGELMTRGSPPFPGEKTESALTSA
jgi:hypothetical protein